MAKIVLYNVRMSEEFDEALKENAKKHGFPTTASYVREVLANAMGRPDLSDGGELTRHGREIQKSYRKWIRVMMTRRST